MVGFRERGIGGGIVRIELDGAPEKRARLHVARARKAELPACPYFHVTVTVPAELRETLRANQRDGYAALMKATAEDAREPVPRRVLGLRNEGRRRPVHRVQDAGVIVFGGDDPILMAPFQKPDDVRGDDERVGLAILALSAHHDLQARIEDRLEEVELCLARGGYGDRGNAHIGFAGPHLVQQ